MGALGNEELIRGGYDAFNRGDIEALTELFAENIVWHLPGRGVMANDYQSRDATFGYFGRLAEMSEGTFRGNLQSLVADGDTVVSRHTDTATRAGEQLDVDVCVVFEMRDGRVVEAREYHYDLYAWDEFWS